MGLSALSSLSPIAPTLLSYSWFMFTIRIFGFFPSLSSSLSWYCSFFLAGLSLRFVSIDCGAMLYASCPFVIEGLWWSPAFGKNNHSISYLLFSLFSSFSFLSMCLYFFNSFSIPYNLGFYNALFIDLFLAVLPGPSFTHYNWVLTQGFIWLHHHFPSFIHLILLSLSLHLRLPLSLSPTACLWDSASQTTSTTQDHINNCSNNYWADYMVQIDGRMLCAII